MNLAIIKTGGKQYLVRGGDRLKVEKLKAEAGETVQLDALLLATGDQLSLGEPILNEKISAKVIRHGRAKKVIGVKYKPKTRQAKRFGHRQNFTELMIEKI